MLEADAPHRLSGDASHDLTLQGSPTEASISAKRRILAQNWGDARLKLKEGEFTGGTNEFLPAASVPLGTV